MAAEKSFEVVVIGGGLAGLAAAVRTAEAGLRVAVIEKGTTGEYLCNSRISGGVFHVAHEDVTKSVAEVLAAVREATKGKGDRALGEALATNIAPSIAWLQGLGASFIRAGDVSHNTLMAAPPRPLAQSLDWMTTWKGRGPDVLVRLLAETLRKHRGEIVLGATATSLVMEAGRCVGVDANVENGTARYLARAVVIADGGFQNDPEMVRSNIAPHPEGVVRRNAGTAMGDGLRMARAAGAAITSLKGFYGHVLSRDAIGNPKLWPYPLLDELCMRGMIVDAAGRRFCDEGRGGVFVANAIAARDDPLGTVVICDSNIWRQVGLREHVSTPNPKLLDLGGTVHTGETIADLARAAGLPAAVLEATVATYNQAVSAGSSLDPPRQTAKAMPIVAPPFYAIPASAGMTFTMGGIRINPQGQVLDTSGSPIQGLYAAGATLGGVDVGEDAVYVGGLSKALVFGKLAGDHITGSVGAASRPALQPQRSAASAKYPALAFVKTYGGVVSAIIGLVPPLIGLMVAASIGGGLGVLAAGIGIVFGGGVYLLMRVLIELVRLISETLLPSTD